MLSTLACENGMIVLPVETLEVKHLLSLVTLFVVAKVQSDLNSRRDRSAFFHRACRNSESPIEVIQFLVEQGPATVYHEYNHFKL